MMSTLLNMMMLLISWIYIYIHIKIGPMLGTLWPSHGSVGWLSLLALQRDPGSHGFSPGFETSMGMNTLVRSPWDEQNKHDTLGIELTSFIVSISSMFTNLLHTFASTMENFVECGLKYEDIVEHQVEISHKG